MKTSGFVLLKKCISLLFLLIYLFSTTEAYQLSKTPLLFEHYYAHKAADKSTTLFSFLYEHYLNNDPTDPDYRADMQLPFKSGTTCIAGNISSLRFVQQPPVSAHLLQSNQLAANEYPLYHQPCFSSTCLATIWQPPKHG